MLTIGGERALAVDADAHVIETEQTWSYLDRSEEKCRPTLVGPRDDPLGQYRVLDDKIVGFRFVNMTARELEDISQETGHDMRTDPEARDMACVDLRLEHMDQVAWTCRCCTTRSGSPG